MADLVRRFQDFYDASTDEEREILATAAMALEALRMHDEAEVTGFFFDEADALFGRARFRGFGVPDLLARVPEASRVFSAPFGDRSGPTMGP